VPLHRISSRRLVGSWLAIIAEGHKFLIDVSALSEARFYKSLKSGEVLFAAFDRAVCDHYAEIMNHFTEALGLSRYTLYMQDYGGPVGFRMALAHADRIEALIVQDAVAHNEGLGANWKTRRAFWADRAANEGAPRTNLLSLPTTRTRHVGNDPNLERYDPDLWIDEFAFLNQSGQADLHAGPCAAAGFLPHGATLTPPPRK
jgi:pimeloyl-ACP methyl ester carboxylesterase